MKTVFKLTNKIKTFVFLFILTYLKINVVWHKAYQTEKIKDVFTGLNWYFSFLGASLPPNCLDELQIKSNETFEFDMSKYGFSESSEQAWSTIIKHIKKSDYYKTNDRIDIGRLISLTLNSTWHYYELTDVSKNFKSIKSKYQFDEKKFAVIEKESCIALGNRKIQIGVDQPITNLAYIGTEGAGSILDDTFKGHEFEVIEIMENSMLRFSIYNTSGKLIKGTDAKYSIAGKPSKCLWCHESSLSKAFNAVTNLEGYYTINEFDRIIERNNADLKQYRDSLKTTLNLNKLREHKYVEILYISFMEPSIMRLSNEWNLPVAKVKQKVRKLKNHPHHEFEFLGNLYNRAEVDELYDYPILEVPTDARETSVFEPNYFN